MNFLKISFSILCLFMAIGCSSRGVDEGGGNVVYNFNEKILPLKYQFFPNRNDSLFGNFNGRSSFCNLENSNDKGMIIAMGAILSVVILIELYDVVYFQCAPTSFYLTINDGSLHSTYKIKNVYNKISIIDSQIQRLNSGELSLIISAQGKYAASKVFKCNIVNGNLILK
jgi:hypothetical protein